MLRRGPTYLLTHLLTELVLTYLLTQARTHARTHARYLLAITYIGEDATATNQALLHCAPFAVRGHMCLEEGSGKGLKRFG